MTTSSSIQIFKIDVFNPTEFDWIRWEQRLKGAFSIFGIRVEDRINYYVGNTISYAKKDKP